MESKEEWISKVLQSSKGIENVNPNPFLFAKISNRIEAKRSTYFSSGQVRMGLASAIVLIMFNFMVLKNLVATNSDKTTKTELVENSSAVSASTDYAFFEEDYEYKYLNR